MPFIFPSFPHPLPPHTADTSALSLGLSNIVIAVLVAGVELVQTGTLLLCTVTNSALTTSIVGVLKGALAVVLGFFFLGGARVSYIGAFGIAVNLLGGVFYVAVRHVAAVRRRRRLEARMAMAMGTGLGKGVKEGRQEEDRRVAASKYQN
eukprot:CAMPEP_0175045568 /NCGR_PEP_ID=MMETSP0052_2-20121109/4504_1 /TAXON_ID=51329 ORGANISM="Polytomella parva, Strain SAG 63-3" /NCGR_SAMPLE_ID=MMETSP0052_2 /ASSEMBLY_ACC=CAM_ASM_000194 /LENGTH=149 /DNA_ID=CAMNT_0016309131 /DNA_START=150 /DNA_END=599 /DNA_ORIENTATION=-